MALSDELAKLTARAKETETRAAAARGKARADLEQEVSSARAAAQAQGDKLRQKAADSEGQISDWWVDAQKSWNERIDAVREDIESKKTAHDVGKARWKADRREDDAISRSTPRTGPSTRPTTRCSTRCSRGWTPTTRRRPRARRLTGRERGDAGAVRPPARPPRG